MRQTVDGRQRDMYSPRVPMTEEQAEARRAAIESYHVSFAKDVHDGRFHYRPDGTWPDCSRCGQSCTSVYAGKTTCIRCTSNRRLNG